MRSPMGTGLRYVANSRALTTDQHALRALTTRHLHAHGLQLQVESVQVIKRGDRRVSLRVTDRLPAYDVLDADGRVVAHRPARGLTVWRVDLTRVSDSWLI